MYLNKLKPISWAVFCLRLTFGEIVKLKDVKNEIADKECNFQGDHLKFLGLLSHPLLSIEPKTKQDFLYQNETETFIVTPGAHGMIPEILQVVSYTCNFTFELHLEMDNDYGDIDDKGTAYGAFKRFLDSGTNCL